MNLDLKGRSVLITGASRGIGLAIAETMAAEGCNLHLAARDEARLKAAAERLSKQHGVDIVVHRRDLSETAEVESLGRACQDVDILVNNAGDIPTGTLEQVDSATWRKAWDLKVFGYVDLTRMIYPRMCARGSGVIVNIVGAAGKRPNSNYIAGCMANIALNMFTQCLGGESMRHGVRVVAVNPGPTISDRHLAHVKERAQRVLGDENRWPELHAQFPAKRAGSVQEVADTVAFLASDRASFTSGASIKIDGGLSVARREQ
jgi:NAD(P)-dependent dehydrogenase (short-subunit alcohol dehydrogenase family)